LQNAETKYIGEHKGQGIDNIIDQDDLKASHVPIPKTEKDRLKILGSFYGSTNLSPALTNSKDHILAQRKEYNHYKSGSEISKVPFSQPMRNRIERAYDKFDKVNGYGASVNKSTFSWKVPTYDLNWAFSPQKKQMKNKRGILFDSFYKFNNELIHLCREPHFLTYLQPKSSRMILDFRD